MPTHRAKSIQRCDTFTDGRAASSPVRTPFLPRSLGAVRLGSLFLRPLSLRSLSLRPLSLTSLSRIRDPRLLQIATLAGLLLYGLIVLRFELPLSTVSAVVLVALATQAICSKCCHLPRVEPKSALISALSLSLLLRTGAPWCFVVGAAASIASKFLFRFRGKHLWNPTTFGITILLLFGAPVWVSPGQWGSGALLVGALACVGMLVLHRATRSDVTLAFLAAYGMCIFGRALWLGDPLRIPLHQLQSGALLIFAFFMISDPKTTPDSRSGRIIFAAGVAAAACYGRFHFYSPDALMYALFFGALSVPLLDVLFRDRRYQWPGERAFGDVASKPGENRPAIINLTGEPA